jgi:uncharacterized protein (TIGR03435 family)
MRHPLTLALCLTLTATALALGQQPATLPTFDVASIKPNRSADIGSYFGAPRGQLTATNVTLWELVRNAYRLQGFQIVGGPEWLLADRFDVVAKPAGEPAPEQLALMVQALLAERFRLAVHRETRELPVYELRLAAQAGVRAAGLQPSTTDCAAITARGGGAPPSAPPPAGVRPACGIRTQPGRMIAGGVTMARLAGTLSVFAGRIVIDRTGLEGGYDFDLAWTPDRVSQEAPPPGVAPLPAADPNGPSLFTALTEQLGLKLESGRGPVEVLVIDHAERPTPD